MWYKRRAVWDVNFGWNKNWAGCRASCQLCQSEVKLKKQLMFSFVLMMCMALAATAAYGEDNDDRAPRNGCAGLPSWEQLKTALTAARHAANGGLNLDMWGTIVDRDGVVCAVAFTGSNRGDQWPGSRVISAQKANTANAFSLPTLSLSIANLYTATQPGGPLFGLQHSRSE